MKLFCFLASVAGFFVTLYFLVRSLFSLTELNDYIFTTMYAVLMLMCLLGIAIYKDSLPHSARKLKRHVVKRA